MIVTDEKRVDEVLERGVGKTYPGKEEVKKALMSGKKLRIYQGFDPSAPSLHLGNLVGVLKLRQFLELGHEVIFLVGDFTGMIGDPTDKASARKKMTRKEVKENCKGWKKQLSNIVQIGGRKGVKMKFNSSWLDEISFKDMIDITSNFTVQQLIQRDFFQDRIREEKPIYLHEFLYPVAQALDSVKMEVDLEVGGSDQTFNMLMGRHLSQTLLGKEKLVLTTELLVDKEGRKVGKTTGNAVFLDMSAEKMFGSVMSFPDEVILPGFELLTTVPYAKVKKMTVSEPMKMKKRLAFEIVTLVKGKKKAKGAQKEFERVFQKRKLPQDMKEVSISGDVSIPDLLVEVDLVDSKTQAKRLVKQGAVRLNGEKVEEWRKEIKPQDGDTLQVGKRRFVRFKNE